jgi:hypothetical protein
LAISVLVLFLHPVNPSAAVASAATNNCEIRIVSILSTERSSMTVEAAACGDRPLDGESTRLI